MSLLLVPALAAQTIEKKAEDQSYGDVAAAADQAFKAKNYAGCIEHLRVAIKVAAKELRKAVLAAMPEAPEGMDEVPQKAAAVAGLMDGSALIGIPIEKQFRAKNGQRRLTVQVHVNSNMVKMLEMGLNMAAMDPKVDVVNYGPHRGMLKKNSGGKRLELQVILDGKHLLSGNATGFGVEELLAVVDQAFVDRLMALLRSGKSDG
ncbi:MAG: hypothetical protein AAF628_34790 [Planctomycetota bacterium]